MSRDEDLRPQASFGVISAGNLKPRPIFVVKFVLSAAMIWYIASKIDTAAFAASLRQVRPALLALALAQFLLIPLLGALRWGLVLQAIGRSLSARLLVQLFWVGMAFSQILPSASGGDAVRGWLAWRAGVSARAAIYSILLERIAVVATLIAVVSVFAPGFMERTGLASAWWSWALLVAATVGGLAVLLSADQMLPLLKLHLRLIDEIVSLSRDSRRAFLSGSGALLALACFVTHANLAIAAWWLAAAINLPIGLLDLMALIPIVLLVSTLPISIGGWGVREGMMVMMLGNHGVSGADALAFSILFGLAVLVISLPGLPAWLMLKPTANQGGKAP